MKINTKLTKVSRNVKKQKGFINPGIYKGSTMIFDNFDDYINDIKNDDDRAAKQDEICSAADKVDRGAGVVIVTDIFGGSPSNLAMLACRPDDRRIVYGANLPMLLKLAKSRGLIIDDAVKAALSSGRQYLDAKNISNTGY